MYKSLLFSIMIVAVFCTSAWAQSFSLGPKVGLNFSNATSLEGSDMKVGYAVGIVSTYSIKTHYGVGVDVLYSSLGYSVGDNDVAFNYIRIPVLFKYFFNHLGDAFRPRLDLGLTPGILVNAQAGDHDIENANSLDLALTAGIGFNYRLAESTWLNFDIRQDLGLTPIVEDTDNKHISTGINVGVAFGIK